MWMRDMGKEWVGGGEEVWGMERRDDGGRGE